VTSIVLDVQDGRRQVRQFVVDEQSRMLRAKLAAVTGTTGDLKEDIRSRVVRAFEGGVGTRFSSGPKNPKRIANTVRSRIYGAQSKTSTAGYIYSRFGRNEDGEFRDYFSPFISGATLRARRSTFLYVPLEKTRAARERRPDFAADPNISIVPTKSRDFFLVVRRRKGRGKSSSDAVIAILARRVKMPKLLTLEGLDAEGRLFQNLLREINAGRP
jgi:hypothetical protein